MEESPDTGDNIENWIIVLSQVQLKNDAKNIRIWYDFFGNALVHW